MDPKQYKAYHESVMSNNEGTTPELTLLCIFFSALSTAMVVIGRRARSYRAQFLLEYISLVLLVVLTYMLLFRYIIEITKVLVVTIYIQCAFHLDRINAFRSFRHFNVFTYQRLQCISNFRGVTYLLTVFFILAVDFAPFPRIFAKTERYGFSLMDTGVGLFTLTSGLVHKTYTNPRIGVILKDNYKLLFVPAMGIIRTFLVKSLDYQEHVTEYGVHWNFFYTLAAVKLISTILLHVAPSIGPLQLALGALTVHQVALRLGMEKWVFSDIPRDTFIRANREGLASILGYVALYLFAVYIKSVLVNRALRRGFVLANLSIFWASSFVIMFRTGLLLPVSRTLANAGYVMFTIVIFMVVIILFYIIEVILYEYQVSSVPIIFDAFNKNGLCLFLVGNILTGLINMTFQTLLIKTGFALFILIMYMTFLLWFAMFLYRRNITLF